MNCLQKKHAEISQTLITRIKKLCRAYSVLTLLTRVSLVVLFPVLYFQSTPKIRLKTVGSRRSYCNNMQAYFFLAHPVDIQSLSCKTG